MPIWLHLDRFSDSFRNNFKFSVCDSKIKLKFFPLYNVDGVYFIFISFTNLSYKKFSLKTLVFFSLIIIYLISTFLFIGFSDNIRNIIIKGEIIYYLKS